MTVIQCLRLFSISAGLIVGLWLPLKIIGFLTLNSIDVYLDILISIAAAINIYINFHSRDLGLRQMRQWKNWANLGVFLDFICLMPLLLIQDLLFKNVDANLVFLNLLAARHIWKIKDFLDEFDNLKPIVYRIVPLVMIMPLLVHLIACGWIALGSGSAEIDNNKYSTYIKALYWAMTTLTTVGYGDIVAKIPSQMIYASCTQLVGVGVFGFILSNVASLLSRLDAARESHMDNLDQVETFMNSYRIPTLVKSKVRAYYHYVWKKHKGRLDTSLLEMLPGKLKSELNFSINQTVIERVSFLKTASRELLEDIMLALEHRVFVPDERIFRAGDPGDCLYMIHAGQVEVLTAEGNHIAHLSEGSVFGEIALISEGSRTATIKANTYCDLYALPKKDFLHIVSAYPSFKADIEEIMRKRQAPKTEPLAKAS